VNATSIAWAIAVFFGCSIMFAAIRRLTDDSPAGIALGAQVAAMAVVIAAIVLFVRWQDRQTRGDSDRE
jgi:hypothetical protein